ncbi:hypothetical protein PoB_005440200 [Plakobranchus ocellatus]|uniref:Uncharacterized protein n=1 Tax=Plakobranchus ocellatus TaxID=259542 RepID=A0AAV4C8P9_9GAST|nr:hypothetical protein PoB_005440200 [Plakobranchus ocellatus]
MYLTRRPVGHLHRYSGVYDHKILNDVQPDKGETVTNVRMLSAFLLLATGTTARAALSRHGAQRKGPIGSGWYSDAKDTVVPDIIGGERWISTAF